MSSSDDSRADAQADLAQPLDRELVSRTNDLDMDAGLKLMELYVRPALADLEPDRLAPWKDSDAEVDGTPIRQVYATLKLHWLQHQGELFPEQAGVVLNECYSLLREDEIKNPYVWEALRDLEMMLKGDTALTNRCRNRIRDLAEAKRSEVRDPHTRAALGHLIVRNMTASSESEARSFEPFVAEVAQEFEACGDGLGRAYVLLVLARLQLTLSKTPDEARESVRALQEAAEQLGEGGDFATQGTALGELAAMANGGSFQTPANDVAEALLRQAKDALAKGGRASDVKLVEQILSYASPPNTAFGLLLSAATMGVLIWAFVKGLDALLFFAFLGGAILIHEGGHALAAAMVGIPIRRFRVGIGTRLFGFSWRNTRMEFCLVPFMGYVVSATTTESWRRHRRESEAAAARGEPAPPKPELDLTEEVKPYTQFVSRPRRLAFFFGGLATNFLAAVCLIWGFGVVKEHETGNPVAVQGPISAAERVITTGGKFYLALPQILAGPGKDRDNPERKSWIRRAAGKGWWNLLLIFAITNCLLLYFNLLPVPPLDGSHLLLTGVEMVRGQELSAAVQAYFARAGYVLIAVLIVLNIYHLARDVLGTIF